VFHWREVFAGIVALNLCVSLLLFLAVPERTATQRGESVRAQLAGFARVARDPSFWRVALCIGASQVAAVSLSTLWVATWLRDIAGYSQAEVARALLVFSLAMMAGYVGFGRAADALTRRGQSTLPLLDGGGARLLAVLAPLPARDGRAREHRAQRLRVRRHVQRPVGGGGAAQLLAADAPRLLAAGLSLGARDALAGAVRRPGLALVGPALLRYAAVKMSL
jgi:hypothetical protein